MPENRLALESSPYLLQHKDNPVAWYGWGPEAFEAAKSADKPILLSVGYAACHWCHVMAHESFEDAAIAAVMNELFVNIKVDREERPDLDTIYQSALALLGEPGGWPLTMFLTADGEPFWGGTYFPATPRYGRPGFTQVLRGIASAYGDDAEGVAKNVGALRQALAELSRSHGGGAIPLTANDQVAERLLREIDPVNGGIGGAPKFPQPTMLKLLWRAWKRTGNQAYRDAVELTLTHMCQGGIYDHLGGGFARYTVEARWLVPHFEKMLYDNAQLIDLLTWAWQDSGNPLYETRLRETIAWALTDMVADRDGTGTKPAAFASSYDADSEGEEGKFYVWQEAEIDALLGADTARFKAAYDVTVGGNWEGKNILNRLMAPELGDQAHEAALGEARKILLAERAKRVPPGWDDKVLADWNGLMIAALARAGEVLPYEGLVNMAASFFRFVQENMTEDGRLKHAFRHGRLRHPATLDDHANLCDAALALHAATGESAYRAQAELWADDLHKHYWDSESGGYFLAADDTEQLIVRPKSAHDNATPSGNGTMVGVLARLYYLTGREFYRTRAEAVIAAFSGELQGNFLPLSTLLNSSEMLLSAQQVVIVGDASTQSHADLLEVFHSLCRPNAILQCVEAGAELWDGHPAAGKAAKDGRPTVYICRGPTCSLPICEPEELKTALVAR